MKLHILGSGTCIPSQRRGSAGYVLRLQDSVLLLDCGNGTTWKLENTGIDYLDIDKILITHFHPDHTSDLVPFLFGTKYNMERKRNKPLQVMGPEGFREFFLSLNNTFNNWLDFDQLLISEVQESRLITDEYELIWTTTPHTDNSIAYRIASDGKILVYTGDTDYSEEIAEFARGCDLLLIECAYPEGKKVEGHLTPEEVSSIINAALPGKTVITHMYPECDQSDLLKQIKKYTDSNVILAEDMMEIEV